MGWNSDVSSIWRDHIPIRLKNTPSQWTRRQTRGRCVDVGFTLLELMIVITIVLTLAAMAAVRYDRTVAYSKEAALHHDLSVMREAIEQYTLDHQEAPESLDGLVSAGYLSGIPVDPVTGAKDWITESSDVVLSPDGGSSGISNVHSGSDRLSPFEHTPYSSW